MSLERALDLADAAAGQGYSEPDRRRGRRLGRGRDRGRGGLRAGGRPSRRGRRARRGRGARAGGDALRDARAVRAPRPDPALRRADPRGRHRQGRRRLRGSERRGRRRRRAPARGRRRDRARDLVRARRQNEAWRTWVSLGRPHVVLKLAVSLDGRAVVPGRRWVTGEASRRRVHELRASVDAVGVGMGTVLADAPRLDARDVPVARQPRRLAFGRGPLPAGSELELLSGPTRGRARGARGRGRPVAPPRGRSDARDRLSRGCPGRPPARLLRAGAGGRRAGDARRVAGADRARRARGRARRRRRPARRAAARV